MKKDFLPNTNLIYFEGTNRRFNLSRYKKTCFKDVIILERLINYIKPRFL